MEGVVRGVWEGEVDGAGGQRLKYKGDKGGRKGWGEAV